MSISDNPNHQSEGKNLETLGQAIRQAKSKEAIMETIVEYFKSKGWRDVFMKSEDSAKGEGRPGVTMDPERIHYRFIVNGEALEIFIKVSDLPTSEYWAVRIFEDREKIQNLISARMETISKEREVIEFLAHKFNNIIASGYSSIGYLEHSLPPEVLKGDNGEAFLSVRMSFKQAIRVIRQLCTGGISAVSEFAEPVEKLRHIGTILLVDDDKRLTRAYKRRIEGDNESDVKVEVANSGKEALEYLRKNPLPDAVVSDITMPEMNGIEFHKRVKEEHPGLAGHFYFSTGLPKISKVRQHIDTLGVKVIEKPYDMQTFLKNIKPSLRVRVEEEEKNLETEEGIPDAESYLKPSEKELTEEEREAFRSLIAGRRIMYIEDEELLRTIAERVLGNAKLTICNSGEEALEVLESGDKPEMIVCDMVMEKGMSGQEVSQEISKKHPELMDCFHFLTGGGGSEAGLRDFLEKTDIPVVYKPFDGNKLLRIFGGYFKTRPRKD